MILSGGFFRFRPLSPMNSNPILQTERIDLYLTSLTDAPFTLKLLNSPTWLKFIGDRGVKNLEDAEKYIQDRIIGHYNENGFSTYLMRIRETNIPIGFCGLVNRAELDCPDIGFSVLPEFAGKGYTSEAAQLVLEYARDELMFNKISAITLEENLPSRRVIEKIGLTFVKTIRFNADDEELMLYELEF